MVDKSSGENVVSALALEMRRSIAELAGPRGWSENRKRWLDRAARTAGISWRQAKSLFYCEGNPRGEVVELVRAAMRERQKNKLREARDAYQSLIASIARAEAALRIQDADFHSPEIDAFREILGGTHSPVDSGSD